MFFQRLHATALLLIHQRDESWKIFISLSASSISSISLSDQLWMVWFFRIPTLVFLFPLLNFLNHRLSAEILLGLLKMKILNPFGKTLIMLWNSNTISIVMQRRLLRMLATETKNSWLTIYRTKMPSFHFYLRTLLKSSTLSALMFRVNLPKIFST